MARWILVAVLAGVMTMTGCDQPQDDTDFQGTSYQKNEFDTVKARAAQLQPGMNKLEVMALLGSPAIQKHEVWEYLPTRPGLLVPSEGLRIVFQGGVYVRHELFPIVLGIGPSAD